MPPAVYRPMSFRGWSQPVDATLYLKRKRWSVWLYVDSFGERCCAGGTDTNGSTRNISRRRIEWCRPILVGPAKALTVYCARTPIWARVGPQVPTALAPQPQAE